MDYYEFDLYGLINSSNYFKMTPKTIKSIFYQLLIAVKHCHSLGVTHRDLKPENVYIDKLGVVKLGDFGLASKVPNDKRPRTLNVVTPTYRAPELILGDANYGNEIDMWSLGCILYLMITGSNLFTPRNPTDISQLSIIISILGNPDESNWPSLKALPNYQILEGMKKYAPRFDAILDTYIPEELSTSKGLLKGLLKLNPAERMTADEALGHTFFNDVEDPVPFQIAECHSCSPAVSETTSPDFVPLRPERPNLPTIY